MTHIVQAGENLYRIGLKYNISPEKLMQLNGLPDVTIYVGQKLNVRDELILTNESKILTFSDLCIVPDPIPQDIADALYLYHLLPIKKVEARLKTRVYPSEKSVWRTRGHELSQNRDGSSQHTFEEVHEHGRGAGDWTSAAPLKELRDALIAETNYRRIAVYYDSGFIHCDYKDPDNARALYEGFRDKPWEFKKII